MDKIIICLILHVIDIITGLLGAIKTKTLDSTTLRNGIFKKCGFIACYSVALLLSYYGDIVGISYGEIVLDAIVAYSVLTEIVSIIENACELNEDLSATKLLSYFKITSNDEESEDDE